NGSCTGCTSPAECPGPDDDCQQPTCVSGQCGTSYTPVGTMVANPTAGDCRTNVCDGAGNVVEVVDDTDVPTDAGGQCTVGTCSNGVPAYVSAAAGTACNENGGSICDGSGSCVGCRVADECPEPDAECQTRTCTSGVCGFSYVAEGTPASTQTAGDCHQA